MTMLPVLRDFIGFSGLLFPDLTTVILSDFGGVADLASVRFAALSGIGNLFASPVELGWEDRLRTGDGDFFLVVTLP